LFAGKLFLDSLVPMSADVCCGAKFWLTNRSLVTPIAEHARVPTPGFVEYIWKFALPILLPAFALVSISFFCR